MIALDGAAVPCVSARERLRGVDHHSVQPRTQYWRTRNSSRRAFVPQLTRLHAGYGARVFNDSLQWSVLTGNSILLPVSAPPRHQTGQRKPRFPHPLPYTQPKPHNPPCVRHPRAHCMPSAYACAPCHSRADRLATSFAANRIQLGGIMRRQPLHAASN